MSVIDIITRIDAICKKYDVDREQDPNVTGNGAFSGLYAAVRSEIDADLQVKGLSTEEFAACNNLGLALPERIQVIPDRTAATPKQTGGWAASASRTESKFDSGFGFENEHFQQTEESSQFRQEYEMRKMKQD